MKSENNRNNISVFKNKKKHWFDWSSPSPEFGGLLTFFKLSRCRSFFFISITDTLTFVLVGLRLSDSGLWLWLYGNQKPNSPKQRSFVKLLLMYWNRSRSRNRNRATLLTSFTFGSRINTSIWETPQNQPK